ncbi:MAG TPA: TIM-barrel domain-containing protein [Terriglobales bacterium]|jgi:alpha-glucosidase (family GH31 glycosyl hydrolase)|nr:TIM-barrel domain-containing protein [Terriglobales bacterium]
MVKGFRYQWLLLLIAISFLLLKSNSVAATETLESPALRLELITSPYSYRVIERSSGKVLLSQSSTGITFGPELYPASDATSVSKASNSLQAELRLQLAGRESLPAGTPAKAQVRFTFLKPEVLQISITYKDASPNEISEEFNDQGEHYYGIWEYPFGGSVDNRGADRDFLGLGNERYVHHASARAPFYMTSNRYGIYVETLAQGHYSVAQAGKTTFSFKASQLNYDIIYGPSYADVLNRYNALAGPAFMPPTWAFGSIWWRDDEHADLRGVTNAQEKVMQDADRLQALHLPAGAIWLDRPYGSGELGWGAMDFDSSFPDPAKMIHDLNDRGMNLLLWTANRCSGDLYKEGSAKGYLFPLKWPAADIRRPEVYDWFKQKLNAYVRMGVKGYKIDRGEENEMPESVENELAVLFPKLSAEGLATAYGNDYFDFVRNANDTTRKYAAVWNGDSWSTFGGLQVTVKNGLRAGAMNFPMWGSDTGGYFAPPAPDNDLLARWLEFSAFSPMMEVILGPQRTLWDDYSPEVVGVAQKYVTAHHDLIPYTRSAMYQATQTGMPIMRALIFAFPDDQRLSDTWDEYLYGDSLLVAPVTTAKTTEREVYLPAGNWMNYDDKRTVHAGASTIKAAAPLGMIPVYVREGAIIPRGDIVKLNNNWESNWSPKLRLEVFPSSRQKSWFDYYTGGAVQRISAVPDSGGLKIEFGDLGTPGTVEVYCQKVKAVTRNGVRLREGADYGYDRQANKLTVSFQGATVIALDGAQSLF